MKFSELVRFAQENLKNGTCQACESPESGWTAIGTAGADDNPRPVPGLMYLKSTIDDRIEDAYLGVGHAVIALECDNCGYLRLFSVRKIRQWIDDNQDGREQEESSLSSDNDSHTHEPT